MCLGRVLAAGAGPEPLLKGRPVRVFDGRPLHSSRQGCSRAYSRPSSSASSRPACMSPSRGSMQNRLRSSYLAVEGDGALLVGQPTARTTPPVTDSSSAPTA